MKTLQFKCTLLSDVILNQKAATDGANQTLDFIPGSNFLGIVASEQYDSLKPEQSLEIFHSGKVRFGDAHPSASAFRGLKVPAAMMAPKLKTEQSENYIHHLIPDHKAPAIRQLQLKQCRTGFYDFSSTEAKEIKTTTSFAVKSAYDADLRRAKDEQMFGYESLSKGLTLLFEVEADNDTLAETTRKALIGEKRLGRSRTAQYGLVKIEEQTYQEVQSRPISNEMVAVYADSRLIFLDEYGLPTFRPTPKDLGIDDDGAKICWEKSQIRTFQYAPYNYKRQCFDTDRCGIEKGSVIVIEHVTSPLPLTSHYVGVYQNEGFGKVIYNPNFLSADADGKATFRLTKADKNEDTPQSRPIDTPLLTYLNKRKEAEQNDDSVYKIVNNWIAKNESLFDSKEKFASQWGTIRAMAMAQKTNDLATQIENYISHGIKSDDWNGKRLNQLKGFMNEHKANNNFGEIMVNLAAEMAKVCSPRKEENNGK